MMLAIALHRTTVVVATQHLQRTVVPTVLVHINPHRWLHEILSYNRMDISCMMYLLTHRCHVYDHLDRNRHRRQVECRSCVWIHMPIRASPAWIIQMKSNHPVPLL
ncbi:unnamed protein product [Strongylus vulgaris]|uniref:Uncharacterized protein n=1 Tax=Strongylus vulgaris TaxID=40348 RepID=A0A3P7KMF4_STRVU|nr:unnamed protein product [Strongylus vulgaris]